MTVFRYDFKVNVRVFLLVILIDVRCGYGDDGDGKSLLFVVFCYT